MKNGKFQFKSLQCINYSLRGFEPDFCRKGKETMNQSDIKELVEAEEKRLGVGSDEFQNRHREIMELIRRAERSEDSGNSDI